MVSLSDFLMCFSILPILPILPRYCPAVVGR